MERMAQMSYKDVSLHPYKHKSLDTVGSVLHSICCADGISWEEAFRRLIHSAAKLGTMPQDRHSIRQMLTDSGFYIQAGAYADRPVIDIIAECNARFHNGEQVIVNLIDSPNHGKYMPIIPVRTNGILHYELQFPNNNQRSRASEIWIRWEDRHDHSIAPRRKSGRTAKKKEMSARDSEALVALNENPTDNIVGDCAVRALAGVLEISWEEAALKLAEAGDFVCSHINRTTNIERCLQREGFESHGPMQKNGHILTGKEFCGLIHDMFQAGARIFAFSGHHHAVAILVFDGDYKIVDTWDSTGRPILGYWVKYPERPQRTRPAKPALSQNLTALSAGMKVLHRMFGIGEVTDVSGAIAVIVFENGQEKKLTVDWVLKNCKPV